MHNARGRLQSENTFTGGSIASAKRDRRRRYDDARKGFEGMVVVDGDGIMFGARWYALTPCGTRSPFAALCREEGFQPSLKRLAGGMNLPGNVPNASNRS
jgi:hypothetical protein